MGSRTTSGGSCSMTFAQHSRRWRHDHHRCIGLHGSLARLRGSRTYQRPSQTPGLRLIAHWCSSFVDTASLGAQCEAMTEGREPYVETEEEQRQRIEYEAEMMEAEIQYVFGEVEQDDGRE